MTVTAFLTLVEHGRVVGAIAILELTLLVGKDSGLANQVPDDLRIMCLH